MRYCLVNATIITGKKGDAPFIGSIIINNGKIERILKGTCQDKIKKIDCTSKYIMPGLINAHVHLPGSGKPSKSPATKEKVDKLLGNPITYQIVKKLCKSYAKLELKGGCTTIRTVGGLDHMDSSIRNSLKNNGPRMLVSDYALTVNKGHMAGTVAKVCTSVQEFDKCIEDLNKHNVDLIKLMITGGVLDAEKIGEPGVLRMTDEEVLYCTTKAHQLGLKVAAHVESPQGLLVALKNNVDTIEHGAKPNDEILSLFKEKNASLVCTISPAYPSTKLDPSVLNLNEMYKINASVVNEGIVECAKACLNECIVVGLGNDCPCTLVTHYDFYRELIYAHKFLNVSTLDVINMATLQNAKILGIENITGSIEESKDADMLILDNNPITDLKNIGENKVVIYKGKMKKMKVKKYPFVEEHLNLLLED